MQKLNHFSHGVDLIKETFHFLVPLFCVILLLEVVCLHVPAPLLFHGPVDVFLDLNRIFRGNIYRHNGMIDVTYL